MAPGLTRSVHFPGTFGSVCLDVRIAANALDAVYAVAAEKQNKSLHQDVEIQPQGPAINVPKIQADSFLPGQPVPPVNPCPTRHPRFKFKATAIGRGAVSGFAWHPGARTDDAHVPLEDINKLGNLVQRPKPQQAPHAGDAWIVRRDFESLPDRLGLKNHGAEFVAAKPPAAPANTILHEQNGSSVV